MTKDQLIAKIEHDGLAYLVQDWPDYDIDTAREMILKALRCEATQNMPPEVRVALKIILRHVEPGWTNCTTVVQAWLDDAVPTHAVEDCSTSTQITKEK